MKSLMKHQGKWLDCGVCTRMGERIILSEGEWMGFQIWQMSLLSFDREGSGKVKDGRRNAEGLEVISSISYYRLIYHSLQGTSLIVRPFVLRPGDCFASWISVPSGLRCLNYLCYCRISSYLSTNADLNKLKLDWLQCNISTNNRLFTASKSTQNKWHRWNLWMNLK